MTVKKNKTAKAKWNVIAFYEQSWHLLWEHKKLWILGLAAMIYAAGSSGSSRFQMPDLNGFAESNEEKVQKEIQEVQEMVESEVEQATYLVGDNEIQRIKTTETSDADFLEELATKIESDAEVDEKQLQAGFARLRAELIPVLDILVSIPGFVYTLLAIEIFGFIAYSIVLAFAAGAWAEVALMKGIAQAHTENDVDITKSSLYAIKKIKSFLWVKYIPTLRFIFLSLLALLAGTFAFFILADSFGDLKVFIASLAFIVAAVVFIYLAFRLSFRILYAKWHCVVDDLSGVESFPKGMMTVMGNLRKSFFLVFTNMIVSMMSVFLFILPIVFVVILGILLVVLAGVLAKISMALSVLVAPFVVALLVAVILLFSLLTAILRVFFTSVWYLAFKTINPKGTPSGK